MSADLGIGSIFTAANLCYQIYDRCKNSGAEFRDFSVRARNLLGTLRIIDEVSRNKHLTGETLKSMKDHIDPILETLNMVKVRLEKYSSLGTGSAKISDQIGWAIDGGGADLRRRLGEHVDGLTLFNTTVLMQLGSRQQNGYVEATSSDTASREPHEPSTLLWDVFDLSEDSMELSPLESKDYNIGMRSVGQGIQFLILFVLTLLAIGFGLAAVGLYIAALVLFPFFELPMLYKKASRHWQLFNSFAGQFFSRVLGFGRGLWE